MPCGRKYLLRSCFLPLQTWYNTHGPIRGLAAYSVYLLFSQQILRFAGIACSYHALRKKISASQLLSAPANMVKYLLETIREKTKGVRIEIILPKVLYIILLLLAWIAALFSGIAFVYGIQLRKRARGILGWCLVFVCCLFLIFLLMKGHITAG